MSTLEIIEKLPKLTRDERDEIRVKLAEMDGGSWLDADDPLSDADKELLETRLADLDEHPEKSIPWAEAEAQLKSRDGK
jgi:hypothetical protein